MRLATVMTKLVYPAVLVLLPLLIAAGSSGRALASSGPAAQYIGADAYTTPTWAQADTPGSQYYLGHLQSQKFFYSKEALPSSDAALTSNGHLPGCGAQNPDGSYVYPTSTLCIITWDTATSTDGSDLRAFLESTKNDPHHIIMVFCNEAENFEGLNGCVCDLNPNIAPMPCDGAPNFVAQAEVDDTYIQDFETDNNVSNVQTGEISYANDYTNGPNCQFIVPYPNVDVYLVDVYQGQDGNLITTPEPLNKVQGWNNWLTCTTGIPHTLRGISEFAINCDNEHADYMAVAQSYLDDASYLEGLGGLYVWNLWDSGSCAIDTNSMDGKHYAPQAVQAWQEIEAGTK